MLLGVIYQLMRFITDLVLVPTRSDAQLRAEVLALRHQLRVLERKVGKPAWQPADRILLAGLSRLLPKSGRAGLVPAVPRVDLRALVSQLADPATAGPAAAALKVQPPDRLVPALMAGLKSPEWRVRRSCCRLLDDLDFTPGSLTALQRALDDSDPRVRRSAVHTLSCQHCKPSGCALKVQPLFERMARDPNRRVREAVLNPLGWQRHGPWAERLVEYMAANDPSEKLRDNARGVLAGKAIERAANAERQCLPERLRLKTERHPFHWVALDGERLGAGSWSKTIAWDFRHWWLGRDATAVSGRGLRWYFVLPD